MCTKFWSGNMGGLGIEGRIILKCILEKWSELYSLGLG
jgi:hypothetical protein